MPLSLVLALAGLLWTAIAAPVAVFLGRTLRRATEQAQPVIPDVVPQAWVDEVRGSR